MFKKAFGLAAAASAAAMVATGVWAQTGDLAKGKSIEELGRIVFQTSCTPHAQAQFERIYLQRGCQFVHCRFEREAAAQNAVGHVLSRFFDNSAGELALRLIENEKPSRDELSRLKALIEQYEEGQ